MKNNPECTRRNFLQLSVLASSTGFLPLISSCATDPVTGRSQSHLVSGSANISLNRYNHALQQLGDYDRLLPGNPEITFFKGYSLEKMQRRQEAAQQYSNYLNKVNQGKQAQYTYSRLKSWGYVR